MDWKQIADQLAQALRDLYDNGANCPDDKVISAMADYKAACTETDGQTHWDGCYESHYDCAIARVEELERTVEAWEQCSSDLYRTLQNCGPTGHAAAAVLVQLKANVAELLKEKANG